MLKNRCRFRSEGSLPRKASLEGPFLLKACESARYCEKPVKWSGMGNSLAAESKADFTALCCGAPFLSFPYACRHAPTPVAGARLNPLGGTAWRDFITVLMPAVSLRAACEHRMKHSFGASQHKPECGTCHSMQFKIKLVTSTLPAYAPSSALASSRKNCWSPAVLLCRRAIPVCIPLSHIFLVSGAFRTFVL